MADPFAQRTEPLFQKDGQLHTHTSTITSIQPFSTLPPETQSLFKPPPETTPFILTTPSTIFHAQGGGQPSDTGTITPTPTSTSPTPPTFHIHQVRKLDPTILHMGVFSPSTPQPLKPGDSIHQAINREKRLLHSRLHTAGHILSLAINLLTASGALPVNLIDGKASHYPSAAFVEFTGLIPGTAKSLIQDKLDELVAQDLPVRIHFWTEEQARKKCSGVLGEIKGDQDGVRVVEIGEVGSYPCGGTHVMRLGECGRVLVRGIKRQKGVSKVGYEVQDV
ncbi:alanyl-tRNA synthetase-like protein [Plenodomus tracheiphilus IPT5]|uniref:Alanyl-tRNA synthetase-like protein n=1 Tax=Plenodomus tracheiphilus IPT5 TaxID=1408161 RepID=A0A6A7BL38_9PLEO|nr:alanyl-tRNA synthetase-like protein [Plenodomus tracheiphilus IPT5]